ncbi:50S ribosomal protein L17 [Desulfovibrio aminophilus]|nr:50S ribosomal protein L17 [Desulfovibrio aminophilus]MCM0753705.1 50S ribosomal protein L17 [Desulfovibrio aminophilus]
MRHRKSGRKFNRNSSHRMAMFRNMARALLTYEAIRTTEAKAKDLRSVVEKLITLALRDDLHARREAYKVLNNHQMVQKLFGDIGPRYVGGKGGYTRIVKLSQPRVGDAAPMVLIELTKRVVKAAEPKQEEAPAAEKKAEAKEAAPKKAPAKKAAAPKKAAPKKAAEGEEKPKKAAPKKPKKAEEPAAE